MWAAVMAWEGKQLLIKGATEETNFQGKEKTNMGGLQNATLSDTDTQFDHILPVLGVFGYLDWQALKKPWAF